MAYASSLWEHYDFHGKAISVLRKRPGEFLTAYQLAIDIEQAFQRGVDYPDWPVGGAGQGMYSSLAQYLARWLSQKILSGSINDIEVSRLSHMHMKSLAFDNLGQEVRATTVSPNRSETIYRYAGQE